MQNTSLFRSTDGGKTLTYDRQRHARRLPRPVDRSRRPDAPGGRQRRRRRGHAQHRRQVDRRRTIPTEQFYHVITTRTCRITSAARSRTTRTLCVPFNWNLGAFGRRWRRRAAAGGTGAPARHHAGGMAVSYRPAAVSRATSRPIRATRTSSSPAPTTAPIVDKFNRRTGRAARSEPVPVLLLRRTVARRSASAGSGRSRSSSRRSTRSCSTCRRSASGRRRTAARRGQRSAATSRVTIRRRRRSPAARSPAT